MTESLPDVYSLEGLSDAERSVLAAIDERAVVDFHRGLVRIPSVNPPGDVREAITYCEAPLKSAGFSVKMAAIDETMPNLIATLGNGAGPTLLFNAHVDVVPTGERSAWRHDPFGAEIEDGKIYGRGAGDDKASVTAQVMAGLAIAGSGVALRGSLVINEVADEEAAGIKGTGYIVEQSLVTPDFVIVGEQTLNRVALGEKGAAPTELVVRGRTAHGALPWEGANAIEAVAEVIVALRRDYWPILERRTHPHFHHSSGSVNMIGGGVKVNVVPDVASIYIDRRLVPGEEPGAVRAEILEIARQAVAGMSGITVDLGNSLPGGSATLADERDPLVRAMIGANGSLGLSTEPTGFSMATDGRYFARQGVPTIIFGPGDPGLAHVPDEWVGIDELVQATRAYALTALRLLA
ncbi:MAG: M20 family metallopeptidase [Chloroflexia bacterium]|nr:M20 family metallopeptidase [Chloroflexia bacterium]